MSGRKFFRLARPVALSPVISKEREAVFRV